MLEIERFGARLWVFVSRRWLQCGNWRAVHVSMPIAPVICATKRAHDSDTTDERHNRDNDVDSIALDEHDYLDHECTCSNSCGSKATATCMQARHI